jgi:NNP family nitrate/nitrite transporter-like MFS transporter
MLTDADTHNATKIPAGDPDSASGTAPGTPGAPVTTEARTHLALATAGMAIAFWAWGLISPLGPVYRQELGLSAAQKSLLVAAPLLVGALGRIPAGALTDRYGARLTLPLISFATAVPVLALCLVHGYWPLVLVGLLLGTGGSFLAAAVPYATAWFPPERRGLATGVLGLGTGGTALAVFLTPRFLRWFDDGNTMFYVVAAALVLYGVTAAVLVRDAPGRPAAPSRAFGPRLTAAARQTATVRIALLSTVCVGAFVAMGAYLTTYFKDAYDLSQNDAATRTALFLLVAVLFRPLGGALCDHTGPGRVLVAAFAACGAAAVGQTFTPALTPWATLAFLVLAAGIGLGCGAVLALTVTVTRGDRLGTVTGLTGAAGGLGGALPPLVMGFGSGATDGYALGLVLLSCAALGAAFFTAHHLLGRDREQLPDAIGA